MAILANRKTVGTKGNVSHIQSNNDPLIVILNHSQRHEAILIPALLLYYRSCKPIHFFADWNFAMIPIIGYFYRLSETIIVTNKDAKPKFLNVFRRFFESDTPALDRALQRLKAGGTIGIFPEGTVNRDPKRLMRGRPGASNLALASGVKVLPVGILFPEQDPESPIRDGAVMELNFGDPLTPPPTKIPGKPSRREILKFHYRMMETLADVSGKTWSPDANKRRKYVL